MSDFLTHLLNRVQGQGPQLVRRQPSLYERRGWDAGGEVEQEDRYAVNPMVAPEPVNRDAPPLVQPVRETREAASAPVTPRAVPVVPAQPALVREPGPKMADSFERTPQAQPASRLLVETHRTEKETVRERTETRIIERHQLPREPGVVERATVERVTTVLPPPPVRTPQVDATIRSPRPAPGVVPESVRAARPPALSLAPSRFPGARSAGPVALGPRAAEPPAPVTISIGRLEIRPQAAPPPSRPTKAATPRLSLDDYLRSRQGGPR